MGFLATPGSNGKGWRGQSPYGEDCFALSGRSFDIVFFYGRFLCTSLDVITNRCISKRWNETAQEYALCPIDCILACNFVSSLNMDLNLVVCLIMCCTGAVYVGLTWNTNAEMEMAKISGRLDDGGRD
jgi:hypothetical protein